MCVRIALAFILILAQTMFICNGVRAADAPSTPATAAADPENTLYLDLDYGRVVIRMRPDLAPNHVARVKQLVREGFYDGLLFHRVITGFMAQTGDPRGDGTGGSGRMLKAEFTRTPQVRGIVSMARASSKDSADSQWFIVLADSRSALDGKYTVWGEVTSGMEFVDMIRKGDADFDGRVSKPDHIVRLQVAADADRAPTEKVSNAELLRKPEAATLAQSFTGGEFRCSALTNDVGVTPQSALAQVWAHGYLAGIYKAQNALTLKDDAAGSFDTALLDVCKAHPDLFVLAADGQQLAKTPRDLPGATDAFSPMTYTCKDYVAARNGTNKAEADYADLWSFAFVQGYKSLDKSNLDIPFDAKPQIMGVLATMCAKNPDTKFLDLTSLVAAKVKLK